MTPRILETAFLVGCLAASLPSGCRCGSKPPPAAGRDRAPTASLEVYVRGVAEPVGLAVAPGDPQKRLFVVEKSGRIRIVAPGGALRPTPFLDISSRVSTGAEQGLLGLAFHPKYSQNGKFYVNFTDDKGDTRVVEYRVSSDPDRADPQTERELLVIDQPYENHNGGHVLFGPDGKLYIGTGDGGSRLDPHKNGQNRSTLLGKMLRLDVDAPAPKPEMIQVGLRNPWRYSFDRTTGDLYIGDVGQSRWEEVDVLPRDKIDGQNLGWNIMEANECLGGGTCNREGLILPALAYDHNEGCSVTGGYVYRGKALPELVGHYFYSDHCTAILRSFRWQGGRVLETLDWKPILDPDKKLSRITTFGEDDEGELYMASQDGLVYRFVAKK